MLYFLIEETFSITLREKLNVGHLFSTTRKTSFVKIINSWYRLLAVLITTSSFLLHINEFQKITLLVSHHWLVAEAELMITIMVLISDVILWHTVHSHSFTQGTTITLYDGLYPHFIHKDKILTMCWKSCPSFTQQFGI